MKNTVKNITKLRIRTCSIFSRFIFLSRLFSRSQAKQNFTVSEYKKQMSGIYSTTINQSTLDECPLAYKSMDDIVKNIGDTVEIAEIIKPIYNFKAGE